MNLPPYDSWIRLGPGERISIDADVQKDWKNKTAVIRQLRGAVLTAAFEIEYSLDRVLQEVFFPGYGSPLPTETTAPNPSKLGTDIQSRCALFDGLILKSAPFGLSRKIKILKEIARQFQPLSASIPEDLFECLGKVNDIRSKFAHYPVSFVPTDDGDRHGLEARLCCKNEEIILDESYLSTLDTLLSKVKSGLDQLNRSLTP